MKNYNGSQRVSRNGWVSMCLEAIQCVMNESQCASRNEWVSMKNKKKNNKKNKNKKKKQKKKKQKKKGNAWVSMCLEE